LWLAPIHSIGAFCNIVGGVFAPPCVVLPVDRGKVAGQIRPTRSRWREVQEGLSTYGRRVRGCLFKRMPSTSTAAATVRT